MIAGQVGVNSLIEFSVAGVSHVEGHVAAVILGHFLLDDVGLDGDAEMIGLAGEIGGEVIVLILLEGIVAELAPQDRSHAEFVSLGEGAAYFDDLPIGLVRTEINGCADGGRAHVPGFLHSPEKNLIEFVGKGEQFVVVELHDEGNFVRIFVSDRAKNSEGRGDRVAFAFDGELDDVFRVEIVRILGEAGSRRVLDALINGKNRDIAGMSEAPVAKDALKIGKYPNISVRCGVDAVDKIGTGKM